MSLLIDGERISGQDVRQQNGTQSIPPVRFSRPKVRSSAHRSSLSLSLSLSLAVTACLAVANIVKSSLGPVGLDKMLVDQIGDVTITNDGATILKQLEVDHPAAKVLVELSDRQDKEVGDGTTSVVIVAAELLKRANELIKQKIHPVRDDTSLPRAAVVLSR